MKKPIRVKRIVLITMIVGFTGLFGIEAVYLRILGGSYQEAFFSKEQRRQYCGRCGFQQWQISKRVFGINVENYQPANQQRDFTSVDPSSCEHAFFTIGIHEAGFTLPDFKWYRLSIGTLTNSPFWKQPMLIDAFRMMDKTNEEDAFNIFNHLIVAPSYRARVSPQITNALAGTNRQALVQLMYSLYESDGGKLKRSK